MTIICLYIGFFKYMNSFVDQDVARIVLDSLVKMVKENAYSEMCMCE